MNATDLQSIASWAARIAVSAVCLVFIYLIGSLLVFSWTLFGSNYDIPPTWYGALTALLILADVAAVCYIAFKVLRILAAKSAPVQIIRPVVVQVLLLGALHVTSTFAYSRIPQWDFQNGFLDDLSWPGPGSISQDCIAKATHEAYPAANASAPPATGVERPTSPEEIRRIALIGYWKERYAELENRTAVGWRGWVQDVTRHGYTRNPEHRLVTVYLYNPYPGEVAAGSGQRTEAVLSYFYPADVARLAVGREVLVCGRISDTSVNEDSSVRISISEPVINPLPLPEALVATRVPLDFVLEYEVHGCGEGYECPEYELRIDAEGNLTYVGFENVLVTGTHTTRIPEDRLKQLVFELQRTKFLTIDNLPEQWEGSLQGATILRATMDGRSKSVVLPWGAVTWPAELIMIFGKIEEVSNLHQWVNLVKSP
jgi:hypothetical protein